MLDSIREVFKSNLARLIGDEHGRLKEISVKAGIEYRTLQDAVAGRTIPQGPRLARLAAALGVKESDLFVDLERFQERRPQRPEEALAIIARELDMRPARDPISDRIAKLGPNGIKALEAILPGIEAEDSVPAGQKAHQNHGKAPDRGK